VIGVAGGDRLRVVCATTNPGKVTEMRAILGDAVDLMPRPVDVPDVVEDSGSLVGNARLKATAIAAACGLPAVADDTGLEVAALRGAPGVETATLAGAGATDAENRTRLLALLGGAVDRSARFRTIALVAWPDGTELWTEGVCDGHVATEPRGDGGFGYDSIFVPTEGDGRSFAEMPAPEKQTLSHRGKAFVALLELLSTSGAESRRST